jgi:hypothetical protein
MKQAGQLQSGGKSMPATVRSSQPIGLAFIVIVLAILLPGFAPADDSYGYSDPARTTADDIDDHEAQSEDPNDLEGRSHDPDDLVVEAGDPDSNLVEAGDPNEVGPGKLADHEGDSEGLQDLRVVAPDDGYDAIDDGDDPSLSDVNLSAEQIVALRHLKRAELEAEKARDAYGRMRENNYPRGAARGRIIKQRDESMQALEEARRAYEDLGP